VKEIAIVKIRTVFHASRELSGNAGERPVRALLAPSLSKKTGWPQAQNAPSLHQKPFSKERSEAMNQRRVHNLQPFEREKLLEYRPYCPRCNPRKEMIYIGFGTSKAVEVAIYACSECKKRVGYTVANSSVVRIF